MGVLRTKDGVQFAVISPAGFRLLAAFESYATEAPFDLTITSGTDGVHSGPDDPHHLGNAYDLRTHDLPATVSADALVRDIVTALEGAGETVESASEGYITAKFFGFVEDAGTDNEHAHFQLRIGQSFP